MSDTDNANGATLHTGVGRRIIRAGMAVALGHALFKMASILQVMVMGRMMDGRTYDAVYATAFEGCIFALFLLGEEVIGPTFLPVFMREVDTRNEKAAWRFAHSVVGIQLVVLLAVVALIMLFPGAVIRMLTAWDADHDGAKFALASDSLRWLAPSLICLSLGSTTYMILNAYKRFFVAAAGDAAWKFCVLVAVLGGMGIMHLGYRTVILGLALGSIAKLGTHLAGLAPWLRHARVRIEWRNPALKSMLLLMAPLIAGILFAKGRDIFNNVTVLSYLDTDGLMMANSFGRKLHVTIGFLVPYALSIAIFPFLCELVDRDDRARFGAVLSQSGRMLLSVFIPLALVCAVLAHPLSSLLFEGGKFGPQAVTWTAVSMACYTLVLPGAALEYLLMQAFFAHRRMVAVTVAGIAFSFLSILFSYVGIVVLGARDTTALAVIALGFTLTRTLKAVALVALLRRNVSVFPPRETLAFLARTLLTAALAAGLCGLGVRGFAALAPGAAKLAVLGRLAAGAAGGTAGFLVGVWAFRVREPRDMLGWALARLRRNRP